MRDISREEDDTPGRNLDSNGARRVDSVGHDLAVMGVVML